jgi:uncharacterized protein (TIGR02611 family)
MPTPADDARAGRGDHDQADDQKRLGHQRMLTERHLHGIHDLDDHEDQQDTIERFDDAGLQMVEGREELRQGAYGRMLRIVRRIAVAFVGGTVLAVGVVMVVLPGPAVVVIPAGLAILATEFPWARRLLHRVRGAAGRCLAPFRRRVPAEHGEPAPASPSEVRRLPVS